MACWKMEKTFNTSRSPTAASSWNLHDFVGLEPGARIQIAHINAERSIDERRSE